jgi:tRNA(Ile)-lysidine synthase
MNIDVDSGKYVVAVSGGVDSLVLLDLLRHLPGVEIVVAHFDHGIRSDSGKDRRFVQNLAAKYNLPFEYAEGRLGRGASEAMARAARYDFFDKVRGKHEARAIITAHHEDDTLETAIINLIRGTGRKGLSSLGSSDRLIRPLLKASKQEIISYAKSQGLEWREDRTNQEEIYLRNYVRRRLLPQFEKNDRQKLLEIIELSKNNSEELDNLLAEELGRYSENDQLDRRWFNNLPHAVALEVMAAWLRAAGVRNFDRKTLERLVVAAKTGRPVRRFDIAKGASIEVKKHNLALRKVER